MIAILGKLLNIPALVRMRFYPMLNRALLKKKSAVLGRNVQIPGKLNLVTRGNNVIAIGDNFISLLVMPSILYQAISKVLSIWKMELR